MLRQLIDIALVLSLTYAVLILIGERRTLWMVRGFVMLMLVTAISRHLSLTLLSFVLTYLTLGAAVAMAVMLQAEFRRFLERLGRGEIWRLLTPVGTSSPKSDDTIDELVDAVKELSQNRTGALIVLETDGTFDERDFSVPGVQLQAHVSKELIQTIFQTSTLLHDGAMLIQGTSITSAGAILPLSDRQASRQLGTRHRAAMGITERVENCLCVVVSEETGSISLAEHGDLNRPLTSTQLRELLQERFSGGADREVGGGRWRPWFWPGDGRSPWGRRLFQWLGKSRQSRAQLPPRLQGQNGSYPLDKQRLDKQGLDKQGHCSTRSQRSHPFNPHHPNGPMGNSGHPGHNPGRVESVPSMTPPPPSASLDVMVDMEPLARRRRPIERSPLSAVDSPIDSPVESPDRPLRESYGAYDEEGDRGGSGLDSGEELRDSWGDRDAAEIQGIETSGLNDCDGEGDDDGGVPEVEWPKKADRLRPNSKPSPHKFRLGLNAPPDGDGDEKGNDKFWE